MTEYPRLDQVMASLIHEHGVVALARAWVGEKGDQLRVPASAWVQLVSALLEKIERDAQAVADRSLRLMGPGEAAACLGVSMQYMSILRKKNPLFPEPVANLRNGPIWLAWDIEAFSLVRNRKPGPRRRKTDG
mgnify:FL=1